jgi:hypothetical protein
VTFRISAALRDSFDRLGRAVIQARKEQRSAFDITSMIAHQVRGQHPEPAADTEILALCFESVLTIWLDEYAEHSDGDGAQLSFSEWLELQGGA